VDFGNHMTAEDEREIVRVCGAEYDFYDIPPAIRNRENGIITCEIPIPIISHPANNAEADYLARLAR
jgi:hypothetical protein